MNVQKIELHNFMSHGSTKFDIETMNPVIVVGENGAGKSSLIRDSITWATWGKCRTSGDAVVREGEEVAEVSIIFLLGMDRYKVIRRRYRSKRTELELYNGKLNLTGATISETQAKISSLLGMSYEVFVCTACVEQGRANAFSSMSPKEAKKILMDVLQLGMYDTYLSRTKELQNKASAELIGLESTRDSVQKRIESVSLTSDSLEKVRYEVESLEKEKTKLLKERQNAESTMTSCLSEKSRHGAKLSSLTEYLAQLKAAEKNVQAKIDKVSAAADKGNCPLCLSDLSGEHLQKVVGEFSERLKCYKDAEKETSEEILSVSKVLTQIDNQVAQAEQRRWTLQGRTYTIDNAIYSTREKLGFLKAREKELESFRTELQRLNSEVKRASRTWTTYSALAKAFDRNGIATLIIENAVPEIETTANKILDIMSDGKMRISLSTVRELKKGGFGDTLDMSVTCETDRRMYGILSGGEAFRVDLAIRIALSTILARRNKFRCETLLIDEGFGSLDPAGKQRFVKLAAVLSDTFKRIVLVTHTDLSDYYDTKDLVRVEKRDGVSELLVPER